MISDVFGKITNFLHTPQSTSSRIVRGGIWVYIEKFLSKGILFARTIVIARLLFPEDLGLFALASLSMTVLEVLIQPGFNSAIIQERGDVKKYLNSAWSVNVLRGILLAVLLFFFAAPLAGQFFDNSAVVPLAKALAIVVLIAGFENVGVNLLEKDLRFNRRFFYHMSYTIVQVGVLITAAYLLRNVWALLIAAVAGRLTEVIMSYVVHPYRPSFTLDFRGAKHLFRYGKWIALTGVVGFIVSQGDRAIIGRVLDADSLGIYALAFSLAMLPALEVVRALGSLMFPVYAKLQADTERLKRAFVRVLRLVFALSIPASVGIVVLAPEIVTYVYGTRWIAMVQILYVLVLAGIFKSFEQMVMPLFLGTGRAKVQTIVSTIESALIFAFVIPLTGRLGVIGTAWGIVLAMFIGQSILFFILRKQINAGLRTLLGTTVVPVLSSGIMYSLIAALKELRPIVNVYYLIGYIIFGMCVYALCLWMLDTFLGGEFHKSYQWIKENR